MDPLSLADGENPGRQRLRGRCYTRPETMLGDGRSRPPSSVTRILLGNMSSSWWTQHPHVMPMTMIASSAPAA